MMRITSLKALPKAPLAFSSERRISSTTPPGQNRSISTGLGQSLSNAFLGGRGTYLSDSSRGERSCSPWWMSERLPSNRSGRSYRGGLRHASRWSLPDPGSFSKSSSALNNKRVDPFGKAGWHFPLALTSFKALEQIGTLKEQDCQFSTGRR